LTKGGLFYLYFLSAAFEPRFFLHCFLLNRIANLLSSILIAMGNNFVRISKDADTGITGGLQCTV